MKSPLGTTVEYLGAWSGRGSSEWDEVPPREKERLGLKYMTEGEFWYVFLRIHDFDQNQINYII